MHTSNRLQRTSNSRRYLPTAICALGALSLLTGCARTITIYQDPYVNTAAQANRPPEKRTGEPLELAIVCVYPQDLEKAENELLRPGSRVTCRDWYERRPQVGVESQTGFSLPQEQIYTMTVADDVYGRKIGSVLRGAKLDGDKPITKSGIQFKWGELHNKDATIYVFPKFIARDGSVLPVTPAKFNPPGKYKSKLSIDIGVAADRPLDEAQYVKVRSE
ncbi:MAG: hypothetical protein JXO22_13675 [Phycisphaerae bacterium]|nr:hypothetical protein [Phycisphaerae bacterium]